jgi:hypothetical protein
MLAWIWIDYLDEEGKIIYTKQIAEPSKEQIKEFYGEGYNEK